jgi:hypothetical protein
MKVQRDTRVGHNTLDLREKRGQAVISQSAETRDIKRKPETIHGIMMWEICQSAR